MQLESFEDIIEELRRIDPGLARCSQDLLRDQRKQIPYNITKSQYYPTISRELNRLDLGLRKPKPIKSFIEFGKKDQKNNYPDSIIRELRYFFDKGDSKNNIDIIILNDKSDLPNELSDKFKKHKPPSVFVDFLGDLSKRFGVPCPELLVISGPDLGGSCVYYTNSRTYSIAVEAPNTLSNDAIKAAIAHEFFHYLHLRQAMSLTLHEREYNADGFAATATSKAAMSELYAEMRRNPLIFIPNSVDSPDRHPTIAKRENFVNSQPNSTPENYWQSFVARQTSPILDLSSPSMRY